MFIASIKKITVVMSLWSLIISQSVAATIEALYEGQSRTIGNLTLICVGNSASSASNSTDYGALALTNLATGIATSVGSVMFFWPTVKACLKDTCNKCCGIPRVVAAARALKIWTLELTF